MTTKTLATIYYHHSIKGVRYYRLYTKDNELISGIPESTWTNPDKCIHKSDEDFNEIELIEVE